MVKWAIGVRLPGVSLKTIEESITAGDIIRTHLLRPTWHFVSAADLRWLLELMGPQIKSRLRSGHKQLGITADVAKRSHKFIEETLAERGQLTREELVTDLKSAGFENTNNRASQLLLLAELDGFICSGSTMGKDYTYALLNDRVPETSKLNREKSLAKLAQIYFSSRGPATLEDFTWWSGLPATDAGIALEMIKPEFRSAVINSQTYWFSDSVTVTHDEAESVYLLPAYTVSSGLL